MSETTPLFETTLRHGRDVQIALGELLRVARLIGLSPKRATRVATAASELTRSVAAVGKTRALALAATDGDGFISQVNYAAVVYTPSADDGWRYVRQQDAVIEALCGEPPRVELRDDEYWVTITVYEATGRPKASLASLLKALDGRVVTDPYEAVQREREAARRLVGQLKAEREKLAAEKVHRDEVLRTVSHDLRAPLNHIKLAGSLIRKLTDDPKVTRIAQKTAASVDRMELMISDLMDFEAMRHGALRMALAPNDVGRITLDYVDFKQQEAKSLGIELTVDAPRGLMVRCDPKRLVQLLDNLVGNAFKFAPKGTAVEVCVRHQSAKEITITVGDAGPGIPAERRASVFRSYVRGEVGSGVGLGLAICARIVEAHEGTIAAGEDRRGGALMTVVLPALIDDTNVDES